MKTTAGILAAFVASLAAAFAQGAPANGLYRIVSGSYIECCAISGSPVAVTLPNADQSFIRLATDPQTGFADLTFLGDDGRSVFTRTPCPSAGAIAFNFGFGFNLGNRLVFHVDPGPPPYALAWTYVASNSAPGLVVNGQLQTAARPCVDAPAGFSHSNVVAVLVFPPTIRLTDDSTNGALLFVQGTVGRTNVIDASTDLIHWTPISTNVMPATLCPICPFTQFRDDASANLNFRFYRVREVY